MKLIKVKPITNGTRHQLNIQKNLLAKKNNIIKLLRKGQKNISGRSNSTGHISVRHKGGGCKSSYRKLFYRNKNFIALVLSILYDPLRSAFIALNYDFKKQIFFNTLSTNHVYPGSIVTCSTLLLDLQLGCRMPLKIVPPGSLIHSLSINSNDKPKYIKAAGTFGQLIQKGFDFCKIKLPSGRIIEVSVNNFVTLGILSNLQHNLILLGKAGRNRHKGIRPSVRGIAMNPVDHPHGGRTNGGIPSVTPWGKPTRGKSTVLKKNLI